MKWVSEVRVSSLCLRVRVMDYLEAGVMTGVLAQIMLPPSCRRDKCYGMLTGWFVSEVLIPNILYRWEHAVKWVSSLQSLVLCGGVCRGQWKSAMDQICKKLQFTFEYNFKIYWLACFDMYLIWRKSESKKAVVGWEKVTVESSTFLHFLLLILLLVFISWWRKTRWFFEPLCIGKQVLTI